MKYALYFLTVVWFILPNTLIILIDDAKLLIPSTKKFRISLNLSS